MILPLLILFCLRAECIQLGTINAATGIDVQWLERGDIVALEMTFLKPGAGTNAMATIQTTNTLVQLVDIPAEVQDGRVIVAMRWLCAGGVKSDYRLATMDLYRNAPDAPVARATFVSTDGVGRSDNDSSASADSSPATMARRFDSATIRQFLTNDAPVRAWHGALINPELQQAIAEHFRKPADPLPPLPPSTNTMQSAYERAQIPVREVQRKARDEMMNFYRNGGQKGRQ